MCPMSHLSRRPRQNRSVRNMKYAVLLLARTSLASLSFSPLVFALAVQRFLALFANSAFIFGPGLIFGQLFTRLYSPVRYNMFSDICFSTSFSFFDDIIGHTAISWQKPLEDELQVVISICWIVFDLTFSSKNVMYISN